MTTPDVSAEVEAATQRVRELGEQVAEQARKNGLAWLEGSGPVLEEHARPRGAGGQGHRSRVGHLARHHARRLVRSTSEVVLGAMRQQLKAGGAS